MAERKKSKGRKGIKKYRNNGDNKNNGDNEDSKNDGSGKGKDKNEMINNGNSMNCEVKEINRMDRRKYINFSDMFYDMKEIMKDDEML